MTGRCVADGVIVTDAAGVTVGLVAGTLGEAATVRAAAGLGFGSGVCVGASSAGVGVGGAVIASGVAAAGAVATGATACCGGSSLPELPST